VKMQIARLTIKKRFAGVNANGSQDPISSFILGGKTKESFILG
jgi:hypothetical protein